MNEEQANLLEKELPKMVSALLGYTSAIPGLEDITITGIEFGTVSARREAAATVKREEMDDLSQEESATLAADSRTGSGSLPFAFNSPLFRGPLRRCVDANGNVFFIPAFRQCPR